MLEIWQESLGVAFGGTGLPLISSLLFDRGYHGHMDFNHEGKKTGYFFKQFLKMAKKTLTGSGLWPQTSRLLYRCCPIWAIQLLINLDGGSPIKVVAGGGNSEALSGHNTALGAVQVKSFWLAPAVFQILKLNPKFGRVNCTLYVDWSANKWPFFMIFKREHRWQDVF